MPCLCRSSGAGARSSWPANYALQLHAAGLSCSAMIIEENAARVTFEVGARLKPESFSSPVC